MKKSLIVAAALVAVLFVSCASKPAAAPAADAGPKPVQTVAFPAGGTELKIELEDMSLIDMPIKADAKASGGKAVLVAKDSSRATVKVTFAAGKYTGLVNEKSPSGANDAFYVFLIDAAGNETPFRCYPSDPPLGAWELTERVPMAINIPADGTYEIVIKPHSAQRAGETGMDLDYIIFKKN